MSEIIVFATYWNEREWIDASLEQLTAIDPLEVVVCDGCFDPAMVNHSTDGTSEIIKAWARDKANVTVISARRFSYAEHYYNWIRPLPHERLLYRWMRKVQYLRVLRGFALYRLNQMATFNHMIRVSRCFRPGVWFMTYDCDQFYSDNMIDEFRTIEKERTADLLTCKELTFFDSFDRFTDSHEKRDYNNMPHRAYADTRFVPTRHPVRLCKEGYRIVSGVSAKRYVGNVFHYHVKSKSRLTAGYRLGDRKPPETRSLRMKRFDGEHPSVIKRNFL